ncbi:hypothetical protein P7K49_024835 [Saguinus oedipus]|uniref:Olfactory receptor n=1 Tax=Saguinus oedipus TaxID=9490 RepID=A0ABQ9URF0_SAGOE|nr:hypothetical protein P7K49_024835 [Saguinus oedipus]
MGLMAQLSFCGPNQIHHFLCEGPTLLPLSCSPMTLSNVTVIVADTYFANHGVPRLHHRQHLSIPRIPHCRRQSRAFSTRSSHLLAVCLCYSTVIYTYIPRSRSSMGSSKMVSAHGVVSPT